MRDENCKKCKQSTNCQSICVTTSKEDGELMVIGDFPSDHDDKNNTLMAGVKDALVFNILNNVLNVPTEKIYKTYALKCRGDYESKPGNKEINACYPYLLAEIKRIRPKAILLLGDLPTQAVLKLKGIVKLRGSVHTLEIEDELEPFSVRVVPTFSPGYIEYNQHMLKTFAEDINKAYNLSQGIEEKRDVSRITHVETIKDFLQLIRYIKQTGICSFDYETSEIDDKGLGVHDPDFKVTLISASFQHGSAWTIPMDHHESPFDGDDLLDIWHTWNTEVLQNPAIHKIAHNAKFEMHVSRKFGCTGIQGRLDDTMLMHHLIDETLPHGLKTIVDTYFPGFEGYEDLVKAAAKQVGWEKIPMKLLSPYGGTDADLTLRLRDLFEAILLADEKLYRIYRNLTMYANRALFEAEARGMKIDKEALLTNIRRAEDLIKIQETKLRKHKKVLNYESVTKERANYEKQVILEDRVQMLQGNFDAQIEKGTKKPGRKMLDEAIQLLRELKIGAISYHDPINFGSPDQLGTLLYEPHGFGFRRPYDRKKRKEFDGTAKDILKALPDKSGFIEELMLWRSLNKTLSTYLTGVYDRLDEYGYIHTSFLIHGTTSGRLSSRNPNLQNLPNISKLLDALAIEVTGMVKKAFVPPPGHNIVQADYSQAELRIIADFANEQTMLTAYANKQDIHVITAAKFVKVTVEDFFKLLKEEQKRWRTNAKAGNFGLIYGMSAEGLVEYAKANYNVILTLDQAKVWRNDFFDLYPALLDYHDMYIAKAQKFGYVRTLYGRKRHTPEINNPDDYIRSMDERVAINSPIQGTAGEFTIFALALLRDRLDPRILMVNTVHDSIIFYIPFDLMESGVAMIKFTMENLPNEQYFKKELKYVEMGSDVEFSPKCWKELEPYAA